MRIFDRLLPEHNKRLKMLLASALTGGLAYIAAIAPATAATVDKKDMVMVVSVINTTNPYMISNIEGAKALSEKLEIPLEVVNSNNSSQTEISSILSILASGKKVIMFVNTVASSDAPTIVDAVKQAGGYVTIWWNKPTDYKPQSVGDNFVAFQKIPGVESGRCGAKAIGDALGGKGSVVMFPGVQDSTTSKTRVAGFKTEMKEKYPNIKILDERPSNWDPQLAARNAKDLIVKYGSQINGVWSADDGMQIGAMQSFENAGLLDKVKFASDGLYPKTLEDIKSGRGGNAIVGETFHRGYMASAVGLYTAYLAATGEVVPSTLPPEKRESLFKLSCVTPSNYQQYLQYDEPDAPKQFVERLVKNGPWNTEPMPLVGGGSNEQGEF
ncbi:MULTISPECIES: sugar ABC transporter substrate-binding protein [Rhizobium]|uniref:sugar ABC transporter substrate-binding protein n=1 Tax=Rhizobium TaxID=379 RepID=UPI00140970B7|nr:MULTISPECIES: sugar ABC transporter substrate-binding protein [Rhizobium]MBN9030672.1 sugar ABC transporter substrate-binding protein [Hyphomicrobiales bacterium]MDG3579419.1 sugar ABC transporter substrate-binding protein [Rhizobium sp. YJ-22]